MKAIKNYEGSYSVTTNGEIYSHITNKFLVKSIAKNGYEVVTLVSNKQKTTKYVHILVAETYLEKEDDSLVVNHIDGDKTNNKLNNLEWVTYSENLLHAYQNELRDSNRIYSDEFCSKVYNYLIDGWRHRDVCEALNLTKGQLQNIVNGAAYSDIRKEFDMNKIPSRSDKITPEKLLLIARDLEDGLAQNKIAVKYNISKSLVSGIKTRKKYSTLTSSFNF